jgi:hypothetical protein
MPRVVQFRKRDCWRTWFFEECESSGLFGVNQKHLGLIRLTGIGIIPYHVGTEIYLEDAPVFPASVHRFHRVCGPYEVISAVPIPEEAVIEYSNLGNPILFLDTHPDRGPWGNGTKRRPNVCGLDLSYPQLAREFNYYPYRFRFKRSRHWKELCIMHSAQCELLD